MRPVLTGLCASIAVLSAGFAHAQGKPNSNPASDVMPPVNLTITMDDGKPVCAPAELRLPADTNVELRITSQANRPVVFTIEGGQLDNSQVLHHSGDLGHVMSEHGFTVKQNGKGTLRLRTIKAGEMAYACTSTANQSDPFKGKVVLSPPAG